ncbi:hypothetical protein [Bacillus cereus]|uniref:hypothetical protein n=1 Tax=Bacillus cereus TaxID=1396 RepID=UPI000A5D33B7|nr:hypothetical protein [Bacillus cereus]
MKKRKYLLVFMSTVLPVGFLFGCNCVDEDEPYPTEEPSEEIREIINNIGVSIHILLPNSLIVVERYIVI